MTIPATSPATYHTPAGWAERCTMRDDKAEHQVRVEGRGQLFVSCTCHGFFAPISTAEQALHIWRKHHQEMTA